MGEWGCEKCGGNGFFYLDVPVTDVRFGKVFPCQCVLDRKRIEAITRLREMSGISDVELEQWTFEKFDVTRVMPQQGKSKAAVVSYMRKAVDLVREFAENPQGWLILQGDVGTGKSHLAFAVANYRIQQAQAVYIAAVPDMLDVLRSAFNDEGDAFEKRFDLIRSTPLLILDDLGSEKGSDWANERLYMIFNYRYQKRLPMLITTNDSLALGTKIDRRIISRMSEGSLANQGFARILRFPIVDYRPTRQGERTP